MSNKFLKLVENAMFNDPTEVSTDIRWDKYKNVVDVLTKYGFRQEDAIMDNETQWALANENYSVLVQINDNNNLELSLYEQGNFSGRGGSSEGIANTNNEAQFINVLMRTLQKYHFQPTDNTIQESKKPKQDWGDTYEKLVNDQLKKNSEPLVKQMEESKKKKKKKKDVAYKAGYGMWGFGSYLSDNDSDSDGGDGGGE